MYYKECEYCGATLDPGEKCDCNTAGNAYRCMIPIKKRFAKVTTPAKRKKEFV